VVTVAAPAAAAAAVPEIIIVCHTGEL